MKLATAFLPQKLAPRAHLDWHSHAEPYAALVLAGGYAESGDGGRFLAEPGHVVIHSPFSAHADHVSANGAVVVNLPLAIGRLADVAVGRRGRSGGRAAALCRRSVDARRSAAREPHAAADVR